MKLRHRLQRWLVALVMLLSAASPALAQRNTPEEQEILDARLEGYESGVTLPEASVGMTWVLFVVLGVFIAAGLFKDARRSHLD